MKLIDFINENKQYKNDYDNVINNLFDCGYNMFEVEAIKQVEIDNFLMIKNNKIYDNYKYFKILLSGIVRSFFHNTAMRNDFLITYKGE